VKAFEHLFFELIDSTITGLKKSATLDGEIDSQNPSIEFVGFTFDISQGFKLSNRLVGGLGPNE
jgi:hypothetical protein